jgi:hypothetical protein
MHTFCNKRTPHPEPSLRLCNAEMTVVNETKFLGIIFDSKLTFKLHIANLKKKSLKAINLLCVVAHMDWGADSLTLLRLYRSAVRSKLDYGCVVYGLARASYLESLDWVQNTALCVCLGAFRTILGAFRTILVSSLHVEANKLPLWLRSQKLALQYIVKLKPNPGSSAYSSVFQPNYTALLDAKPNIVSNLGRRLCQALSECGINLNCIGQCLMPLTPPWLFRTPGFDCTLYNVSTKSNISRDLYLSLYIKLVSENYEGYDEIITDGSKQGNSVAAVAGSHDKVLVKRLPNHASIFSAEAIAILLALDIISQSTKQHFLILSDSVCC